MYRFSAERNNLFSRIYLYLSKDVSPDCEKGDLLSVIMSPSHPPKQELHADRD